MYTVAITLLLGAAAATFGQAAPTLTVADSTAISTSVSVYETVGASFDSSASTETVWATAVSSSYYPSEPVTTWAEPAEISSSYVGTVYGSVDPSAVATTGSAVFGTVTSSLLAGNAYCTYINGPIATTTAFPITLLPTPTTVDISSSYFGGESVYPTVAVATYTTAATPLVTSSFHGSFVGSPVPTSIASLHASSVYCTYANGGPVATTTAFPVSLLPTTTIATAHSTSTATATASVAATALNNAVSKSSTCGRPQLQRAVVGVVAAAVIFVSLA